MTRRAFLIAAPQSGTGKTTVTLAIMAAFRRRGMTVAPFKCGPDFIDPGYHRLAAGRPSVNLDGWMCPEAFVRDTFRLHAADADVAVVEGVMGLFDGIGTAPMEGSSAQVAAVCGLPVVLVVNARGMAASAAALVKGFAGYDRTRQAGRGDLQQCGQRVPRRAAAPVPGNGTAGADGVRLHPPRRLPGDSLAPPGAGHGRG